MYNFEKLAIRLFCYAFYNQQHDYIITVELLQKRF